MNRLARKKTTVVRWQRAADAIAEPSPEPVIDGIAWANAISILVGESASGKTFVELDMAACVSADREWHGRKVRQGSVVYFGFEGHVGLRLKALHDVGKHALTHVYTVRASDPLSPSLDRERLETPGRGEQDALRDLTQIVAYLKAHGLPPVVLLFVDTIRASLLGSEDSSESASAYLRAVRRIMACVPGAACLLAHHAGWQDKDTQQKHGRQRERGSSAWRGNVDATFYLEASEYDHQTGQARLTLKTLKVRDGEMRPPLHLIRKHVDLPGLENRWGDPVTSCLIVSDRQPRADQTATAEAASLALDRQTLQRLAASPELTSLRKIRTVMGVARELADATLARLVDRGWVEPPGRQRHPYSVTAHGHAVLAEAKIGRKPPASGPTEPRATQVLSSSGPERTRPRAGHKKVRNA